MMDDTARLGIGGNSPPEPLIDPINDPAPPTAAVIEQWVSAFTAALERRNKATIGRYDELADGIARVPAVIDSATDAARVTDFIGQIEAHLKAAHAAHREEKALFLAASKVIDACFFRRGQALVDALAPVRKRLLDYIQQQPLANGAWQKICGDYGAIAYTQTKWDFDIVDLDQVPRGFMSLDYAAVREAIRKDGVREIPGIKIFAVVNLRVKGDVDA